MAATADARAAEPVSAGRLKAIGKGLLMAAGAAEDEADLVAGHCAAADLAGHASHGIRLVPNYIERVEMAHIVPGAPFEVVRESPTTAVIDGHWGFGYAVTDRAMRIVIDKADTSGVAAATVRRQGHIGRLATYPLMAAAAGQIGLITADSGRSPKVAVPFGGREARLGTNPISIAVPSDLEAPLYLDMATSAVSHGKVMAALAGGRAIPQGWILDKKGRASTDPADLRDGGALLPLGGGEGYKGTGLAAMVEILCGLLTGLGYGVEPTGRHNDGCFIAAFKVDAFRPLDEFKAEVADFARYLKDTPPAEGSAGVLYPGEIEHRTEMERRRDGIKLPAATWTLLMDKAKAYGVAGELELEE